MDEASTSERDQRVGHEGRDSARCSCCIALALSSSPCESVDKLRRDVIALRTGSGGTGSDLDIHTLAARLAARGSHSVTVRAGHGLAGSGDGTAAGVGYAKNPASAFCNLRHEFLLVRPAPGAHADGCPLEWGGRTRLGCQDLEHSPAPEYVVDLRFMEQFQVAQASAEYADLLSILPQEFVGPLPALVSLVTVLCSEMASSFAALGLPLPPWRKKSAMLSKWQPSKWTDWPVVAPVCAAPATTGAAAAASASLRHLHHSSSSSTLGAGRTPPQQQQQHVPGGLVRAPTAHCHSVVTSHNRLPLHLIQVGFAL
ncbi:hypothetical protein FOA52_007106 [Chlamydomonas sp. UWO 241]|nr:hypothetical protein FOA52_007106 [Chlamydomonas sp. UWO 241]